jgi:hypothetical protein
VSQQPKESKGLEKSSTFTGKPGKEEKKDKKSKGKKQKETKKGKKTRPKDQTRTGKKKITYDIPPGENLRRTKLVPSGYYVYWESQNDYKCGTHAYNILFQEKLICTRTKSGKSQIIEAARNYEKHISKVTGLPISEIKEMSGDEHMNINLLIFFLQQKGVNVVYQNPEDRIHEQKDAQAYVFHSQHPRNLNYSHWWVYLKFDDMWVNMDSLGKGPTQVTLKQLVTEAKKGTRTVLRVSGLPQLKLRTQRELERKGLSIAEDDDESGYFPVYIRESRDDPKKKIR